MKDSTMKVKEKASITNFIFALFLSITIFGMTCSGQVKNNIGISGKYVFKTPFGAETLQLKPDFTFTYECYMEFIFEQDSGNWTFNDNHIELKSFKKGSSYSIVENLKLKRNNLIVYDSQTGERIDAMFTAYRNNQVISTGIADSLFHLRYAIDMLQVYDFFDITDTLTIKLSEKKRYKISAFLSKQRSIPFKKIQVKNDSIIVGDRIFVRDR